MKYVLPRPLVVSCSHSEDVLVRECWCLVRIEIQGVSLVGHLPQSTMAPLLTLTSPTANSVRTRLRTNRYRGTTSGVLPRCCKRDASSRGMANGDRMADLSLRRQALTPRSSHCWRRECPKLVVR